MNVGVLGVGAMGRALVERCSSQGFTTVAYDVDPEALALAEAAGARSCGDFAGLARASDIVAIMVRTDEQVLASTLGPKRVLASMKPGSLLIIHSTVDPDTTITVAKASHAAGVTVLDACIGGVPTDLRSGNAACFVGGTSDAVGMAMPYLERISKNTMHLGPVGAGNVGKLMKNYHRATERLVIVEALRLGEAMGVSYRQGLAVLRSASPTINRSDPSFDPADPASVAGPANNLFGQILPPVTRLMHSLHIEMPVATRVAGRNPYADAISQTEDSAAE